MKKKYSEKKFALIVCFLYSFLNIIFGTCHLLFHLFFNQKKYNFLFFVQIPVVIVENELHPWVFLHLHLEIRICDEGRQSPDHLLVRGAEIAFVPQEQLRQVEGVAIRAKLHFLK